MSKRTNSAPNYGRWNEIERENEIHIQTGSRNKGKPFDLRRQHNMITALVNWV